MRVLFNQRPFCNMTAPVHLRNLRSDKNIAAVSKCMQENPRQSISRYSQALVFLQTTNWQISHCDLGLHPYKNSTDPRTKSKTPQTTTSVR